MKLLLIWRCHLHLSLSGWHDRRAGAILDALRRRRQAIATRGRPSVPLTVGENWRLSERTAS